MTTFARLAVRLIRRGFLIVFILVPGLSAIVVVQYRYTFADPADAISLQVLAQNPAIRVLFGVPVALENAGGFTVWRTGTFAAVTFASWAFLTATRIDPGRGAGGSMGAPADRPTSPAVGRCAPSGGAAGCATPGGEVPWLWRSSSPERAPKGP